MPYKDRVKNIAPENVAPGTRRGKSRIIRPSGDSTADHNVIDPMERGGYYDDQLFDYLKRNRTQRI